MGASYWYVHEQILFEDKRMLIFCFIFCVQVLEITFCKNFKLLDEKYIYLMSSNENKCTNKYFDVKLKLLFCCIKETIII